MSYGKTVPAAERTLNILETLSRSPLGMSASQLCQQLDLPRSALFALLHTLKSRNYVIQEGERGKYRLGSALWFLTSEHRDRLAELIDAFQADGDLADIDHTLALSRLDGEQALIISLKPGSARVRVVYNRGERRNSVRSADALVMLAGQPPNISAEPRDLEKQAPQQLLADIRRDGYAQLEAEGAVEIAYPICADGVQPVAAILAAVPVHICEPETCAALKSKLARAAARLSFRMGAGSYQPYGWAQGEHAGPSRPLEEQELEAFLHEAWGAKLACVRPDGTALVLPLWYEWSKGCIWMTVSPGARWQKHVRTNPQVSITIDEPWFPLRRAFISGSAQFVEDDQLIGGVSALRRRLSARYMGPNQSRNLPVEHDANWQILKIQPSKISGQQGLGAVDA